MRSLQQTNQHNTATIQHQHHNDFIHKLSLASSVTKPHDTGSAQHSKK